MTDEHRMEQLSRAYVQAVAAVCGCRWAVPVPDYGVDLELRRVLKRHGRWREMGLALYLQLKSTTAATASGGFITYDLDVKAFNVLRQSARGSPTILVLMVLPPDRAAWIDHNEDRLELRRCAYYLSLRRRPAVRNARTVRVRIPRRNQFTPAALQRIMETIDRKEDV